MPPQKDVCSSKKCPPPPPKNSVRDLVHADKATESLILCPLHVAVAEFKQTSLCNY